MRGFCVYRDEYEKLKEVFPKQRFLKRTEIMEYTGIKNRTKVAEFLQGIPVYKFNNRDFSYPMEEVAKAIYYRK